MAISVLQLNCSTLQNKIQYGSKTLYKLTNNVVYYKKLKNESRRKYKRGIQEYFEKTRRLWYAKKKMCFFWKMKEQRKDVYKRQIWIGRIPARWRWDMNFTGWRARRILPSESFWRNGAKVLQERTRKEDVYKRQVWIIGLIASADGNICVTGWRPLGSPEWWPSAFIIPWLPWPCGL